MMIRNLSHLNFKIISEWTEYFRDMLHLKEKLQEAKGELNMERFKNKLIDGQQLQNCVMQFNIFIN